MRSENLRLSPRLRSWTYGIFTALFISGAAWWLLQIFGQQQTEFGPAPHPATLWLLRFHGAAAMATLFILGALLPVHINRGWKAGKNLPLGGTLVGTCAVLIITGWLLYYAGHVELRKIASLIHCWAGISLPAILAFHIWHGRRLRQRTKR